MLPARTPLVVALTCLLAVPTLATSAAAAGGGTGSGVTVAALVRGDDGRIEVRRTPAASLERGRSLAARLRGEPGVVDAEVEGTVVAAAVPDADPLQDRQWGLPMVKAPEAWVAGDAAGQVVAVIDSGVDLDHPDLAPVLVPGWDYVGDDALADDDNGHGTHVAGIAGAAAGNGVGIAGTALRASLMPVKVLDLNGSGSTADVAAGVLFAVENGATVINLSLSGPTESSMLTSAIETALAAGVPVVVATGNQGSSTPHWPAAQAGVVAVGAVDSARVLAPFSNTGAHLAVVAPGVSVLSTYLGGTYGGMSGTSMATPFVAGVLAQVRALAPAADPGTLRSALMTTAVDLGTGGFDTSYGAGLVDAAAAGALLAAPAEEPVSQDPVVEEPATTQTPTTTEEPVVQEPVVEEPVVQEPVVEEPPVTQEPVVEEEPVFEEPVPVLEEPSTTLEPAPLPEQDELSGPVARSIDLACPAHLVGASPFVDVPVGSTHERPISCLVWWAVAQGRTPTTYAPAAGVTRDAMAAFVARTVLAARPGSLPAAPPDAFRDDDASVHSLAIDQLAAAGIVGGTGPGTYAPQAPVTRGQMARFLANAAAHVLGTPLPADRDLFADDAGSVFETDINRVALAGLTGGRADGTYDPAGRVTREQMGSFLARTLDLFVADGGAQLPV